jgi:hypothetical protein
VQRSEVRGAIEAEHDRLSVDHEMLLAQFQRGRDDQREAPRPIMPAPADQTHAALLADKHHPVTVVLHFVQPVRACGHFVRFGGERKRVQYPVGFDWQQLMRTATSLRFQSLFLLNRSNML